MTTRDWMHKKINTKPKYDIHCSSVLQYVNGNFYSYGGHYPLLVNYRGKWICNNRGYSNTTSKHISYCYSLADYFIPLANDTSQSGYGYSGTWPHAEADQLEYLVLSLQTQINQLTGEMIKKKRKNTFIYANLKGQRDTASETLAEIVKL